ncbi:MAG TPA: OmpA family protein [Thermoanaerobaculia bacterium]|nr:OmpA family protein [Thermoanaerobaculia bacterium]
MTPRLSTTLLALLVGLALAACGTTGQPQSERDKLHTQAKLTTAEAALASAQAAGAPAFAQALYEEAVARLDQARLNWNSERRELRDEAALRAVEATHAAQAAEAQALLVKANSEIRDLRADIAARGGTAPPVTLYDPPATVSRGATSMDRVVVAENAIRLARSAGADSVAPAILRHAEETLETARALARQHRQSAIADHLAYSAEMLARQAESVARRNRIDPLLPDLRAERARLAATAVDTRAAEEQRRREQAEQEAARLRQQLDQVSRSEAESRAQLDRDRQARIAAEQNLDLLLRRYETTLSQRGASSAEVEQLRRQVEEQRASLRQIQERERQSETSMGNQIQSLEQALAQERSAGRLTADALARREEELRKQREELQRLQREREESERRRLEAERARVAAIEQLRTQVDTERARATQTEAELARAQEELARRDAAARQRIEAMEAELAKLAETRRTDRGLIVTLPGLFFDTGQWALKPGARNTLAKIADQLRVSQNARITIEGHTDSVGSEEVNQALSERRATAVRDYLVSRGVPANQITTTGLGETSPVATNDTPAGRQQNRRVELIIAH